MAAPVIAWLTDFGTRDHYVGVMKGVALSIAPDSQMIDITHDVAPQDISGGAMELAAAYRYFPTGTIFVAVVDPGVGTARRALAVRAGDYSFVAPDNGLLDLALRDLTIVAAVELRNPRFARHPMSRTFEGRDRFAPAAAWLARGVALSELGPATMPAVQVVWPEPVFTRERVDGEVVRVDRFGNAVTNVDRRRLESWMDDVTGEAACAIFAGGSAAVPLVTTYADVPSGHVCALFGSSEWLEIACAGGDAAAMLGLRRGSVVSVTRGSDAGGPRH